MPLIDQRYREELQELASLYVEMLVLARAMIRDAMRSLRERDPALGRWVVSTDLELNRLEMRLDEASLQVLALYQPVARDLRFVATLLKSTTDLERIGDQAVNIAKRGFDLTRGTGLEPTSEIFEMATIVDDMLEVVHNAFKARDGEVLPALQRAERQVDELNRQVFAHLLKVMLQHPDQSRRALAITSISKALERLADHALNLGEQLVFMVAGEDVRHPDIGLAPKQAAPTASE